MTTASRDRGHRRAPAEHRHGRGGPGRNLPPGVSAGGRSGLARRTGNPAAHGGPDDGGRADRGQVLRRTARLEWRQGSPVPTPSERLVFRPVQAAGELLDLMVPVLEGTLDAHSRSDLTRMSAREAAIRHYEGEFARYTSPREWWQIASLPDGDPVGFVIPARNAYNPIIAYLGVAPSASWPRLHQRHPRRGHPDPGRSGRAVHQRQHRPRQRAHGRRLRAGRLAHHRPPARHDLGGAGVRRRPDAHRAAG